MHLSDAPKVLGHSLVQLMGLPHTCLIAHLRRHNTARRHERIQVVVYQDAPSSAPGSCAPCPPSSAPPCPVTQSDIWETETHMDNQSQSRKESVTQTGRMSPFPHSPPGDALTVLLHGAAQEGLVQLVAHSVVALHQSHATFGGHEAQLLVLVGVVANLEITPRDSNVPATTPSSSICPSSNGKALTWIVDMC